MFYKLLYYFIFGQFIEQGGLRHLFEIFLSGSLQAEDGESWNEVCIVTHTDMALSTNI